MGRIPEHVIQQVLEAVDIVDLVSEYLTLKRGGSHYKGLCPFHQEKTPSFTVNPSLQIYKCFGCGKGGNAVGFLMEAEGLGFPQAVRALAERAGIVVPETAGEVEDRTTGEILQRICAAAAEWFSGNLLKQLSAGGAAAEYVGRRGLDRDTVERFRIGWSPADWQGFVEHGRALGFADEQMQEAGLVLRSESGRYYDRYRGRLVFPIRNVSGTTIGFGGRIIEDSGDQPKYINSPETALYHKGRMLYGIYEARNEIRRERTALVVEGYMDLIALHAAGFANVAAVLGTAFTADQALLIKRFADRVILLFDGDEAGRRAVVRSAPALLGAGLDLRVCPLPEGLDPEDLLRRDGVEGLRRLIAEADEYFRHRIREFHARQEESTPAAYREFVQGMAGAAAELRDVIQRHELYQRISRASGIPQGEVARLAEAESARRRKLQEQESRRSAERGDGSGSATAESLRREGEAAGPEEADPRATREQRRELQLFSLFMRSPDCRDRICERLDLVTVSHRLVREALKQAVGAWTDEDSGVESWAHACGNQRIRRMALNALVEAPRPGDAREADEILLLLERSRLDRRLAEINELTRAGLSGLSPEERRGLAEEFEALRRKRRELDDRRRSEY